MPASYEVGIFLYPEAYAENILRFEQKIFSMPKRGTPAPTPGNFGSAYEAG